MESGKKICHECLSGALPDITAGQIKNSTGIGLYLCKKVMGRLRHQIRIESKVGVGTQVFLGLAREELHPE